MTIPTIPAGTLDQRAMNAAVRDADPTSHRRAFGGGWFVAGVGAPLFIAAGTLHGQVQGNLAGGIVVGVVFAVAAIVVSAVGDARAKRARRDVASTVTRLYPGVRYTFGGDELCFYLPGDPGSATKTATEKAA